MTAKIFAQVNRSAPIAISVRLIELPPASESELAPITRPAAKATTAPKLLAADPFVTRGSIKEEIKEPVEPMAQSAALPPVPGLPSRGWNIGSKPGEAEGALTRGGNSSIAGDMAAGVGSDGTSGGGGEGSRGLGRGTKGLSSGGEALSSLAHPIGGYQTKPRYPESARQGGLEGTTLLKLRVLENGRVGEVLVEQSAGHRDLDDAAAEAVKKWRFEPARLGKEPIAVWVLLPVKFELQR